MVAAPNIHDRGRFIDPIFLYFILSARAIARTPPHRRIRKRRRAGSAARHHASTCAPSRAGRAGQAQRPFSAVRMRDCGHTLPGSVVQSGAAVGPCPIKQNALLTGRRCAAGQEAAAQQGIFGCVGRRQKPHYCMARLDFWPFSSTKISFRISSMRTFWSFISCMP